MEPLDSRLNSLGNGSIAGLWVAATPLVSAGASVSGCKTPGFGPSTVGATCRVRRSWSLKTGPLPGPLPFYVLGLRRYRCRRRCSRWPAHFVPSRRIAIAGCLSEQSTRARPHSLSVITHGVRLGARAVSVLACAYRAWSTNKARVDITLSANPNSPCSFA